MAITTTKLTRTFSFNGVAIPDPGPDFSVEEVRDAMSAMYPDISTAIIEGPDVSGDTVAYKFVRNVGTKG